MICEACERKDELDRQFEAITKEMKSTAGMAIGGLHFDLRAPTSINIKSLARENDMRDEISGQINTAIHACTCDTETPAAKAIE